MKASSDGCSGGRRGSRIYFPAVLWQISSNVQSQGTRQNMVPSLRNQRINLSFVELFMYPRQHSINQPQQNSLTLV